MPTCRNCKRVVCLHGFSSHFGRIVIGVTDHCYVISRPYHCKQCMEIRKQKMAQARLLASNHGVKFGVPQKVKGQYTVMAWDAMILSFYADSHGARFPAFLTRRAGVDIGPIDFLRSMFDKGIKPRCVSKSLLELYTKKYTTIHVRYKGDYNIAIRLQPNKIWSPYGEFADKMRYNGRIPALLRLSFGRLKL